MTEAEERRGARSLDRWLPPAVIVLSVVVVLVWWGQVMARQRAVVQADLEAEAQRLTTKIQERLDAHDEILRGAAGLVAASREVSREEWRRYVEHLALGQAYRGIQGVGLSVVVRPAELAPFEARVRAEGFPDFSVRPAGPRDLYSCILYLEPFSGRNLRAFGFDMYSEPVRRAAMELARDSGEVAMTGKVTLVQETETDVQAGILTYFPIYRGGVDPGSPALRRSELLAWAYSPLRMNDLMNGIVGAELREVRLEVFDGATAHPDRLLFDSLPGAAGSDGLSHQVRLERDGRAWTLRFRALPSFLAAPSRRAPYGELAGAALIVALLGGLAWALVRSRRARSRTAALAESLRESEEMFREMSERSAVGIAIVQDQRLRYVNPSLAAIFGLAPAELVGRRLADLEGHLAPDDISGIRKIPEQGAVDRSAPHARFDVARADGSRRQVERMAAGILQQGRPALLLTLLDVTDRDRMQEELRKTQRLESLALLASGIAHDFNNLLGAVFGHVEEAQSVTPPSSPAAGELAVALSALDRARDLTRQLLTFAVGGAPQRRVLPVSRLLSDAVNLALGGSPIRTRVEVAPSLPCIDADLGQMNQLLHNLLLNARQAMPSGGEVVVSAAPRTLGAGEIPDLSPGPYVEISVADRGPGIPADVLPRIFDPFFTTRKGGTGLGLSTAYSIVHRHGGHIRVESRPGAGTTFRILLPASREAAPAAAPPVAPAATAATRGLRVLLMDDDALLLKVGAKHLRALGCSVDTAVHGEAALDLYRQALAAGAPYQVVILDLTVVGGMGGTETARRLHDLDPAVAAVACSGYFEGGIMADPRGHGFVATLAKPYLREELAQVLSQVARR